MTKREENKKAENIQKADAAMQSLSDNDLDAVAAGGWYEDHFVYDETLSHSKKKKGLLAMTTWNGGTKE